MEVVAHDIMMTKTIFNKEYKVQTTKGLNFFYAKDIDL